MPELNVDVPITYCLLRAEYLYNLKSHHQELIPCAIFGASSLQGRAIGFHCMLDVGAVIYRLPIHAFLHKPYIADAAYFPLEYLELWDCFSTHIVCTEYEFLKELRCDVVLKDRTKVAGIYLFTLDWHSSSLSDNPGEGGHKCAHIIALENGQYAAQPNNRIRWHEPSFVTAKFPDQPDWETNDIVWSVENTGPKWVTENSPRSMYDIHTEGKA